MGTNTPAPTRAGRLTLALFALVAFLTPLGFSYYTGHIWEDFFITYKHSENLVKGDGLVFYPGERVHGFTSPLGTLLPAFCYWATGRGGYLPALWLFRVFSSAAFAAGGVFFLLALRTGRASRYVQIAFALLYMLDAKSVDFTGNGMESGFMLLFLGWGIYLIARDEPRRWLAGGLCWAGLMWTRPDGCVYIAALGLASLLFANGPRLPRLLARVKSAALCAVLYLPWFVWVWSYYGLPVPNTIRAKSTYGSGYDDLSLVFWGSLKRIPERLADIFQPTYYGHGGWPKWMNLLAGCLGAFCIVYWLLPTRDRVGRMTSFCFLIIALYLAFLIGAAPWYFPPATACGLLVLAQGSVALARSLPRDPVLRRWRSRAIQPGDIARARAFPRGHLVVRAAIFAGLVALIGYSGWLLAMTGREFEVQQRVIEYGNRKRVGDWLKEHVGPNERVYAECLGYFGYFSGAHIQDNPGLVSPEVTNEIRHPPPGEGDGFASVGLRLKPEWLALRPFDVDDFEGRAGFEKYEQVEVFDVTEEFDKYPDLYGRGYLHGDKKFTIYHRKSK